MNIEEPVMVDFSNGHLEGSAVIETVRTVSDLEGVFADEAARRAMNPEQIVYQVQAFQPVSEGVEGGLFWGSTVVEPGRVGREYFMTKGHFHAKRDTAEYYITTSGAGALILMEEDRATRAEWMRPGSAHYIPGRTAHRVANIGTEPLTFLACWPSDAGHDYETIAREGFGARLLCIDGEPRLVHGA